MDETTGGDELTTAEAARIAGVAPRTIREWHSQEKITGRKTSAGLVVERRSLAEHLARRGGASAPPSATSAEPSAPSAVDLTPLVRALAESQRRLGWAQHQLEARDKMVALLEAEIARRDTTILQLTAEAAEPTAEGAAEPPPPEADAADGPPWWARLRRWWGGMVV